MSALAAAPAAASTPQRRQRIVLLVLAGLALAGALATALLFVPHVRADIVRLELADSAAAFKAALRADWTQEAWDPSHPQAPRDPFCGLGLPHAVLAAEPAASPSAAAHAAGVASTAAPGEAKAAAPDAAAAAVLVPTFGALRCNLFADSVLLVPGYAGLLVFFTLLAAPVTWGTRTRHAACGLALLAGLFDVAENGMTGRALDDLLLLTLVDATVADVRLASQLKWLLIAAACTLLAALLLRRLRRGQGLFGMHGRWRALAPALLLAAAVLLPLGTLAWRPGVLLGVGALFVALFLLGLTHWVDSAAADGARAPGRP